MLLHASLWLQWLLCVTVALNWLITVHDLLIWHRLIIVCSLKWEEKQTPGWEAVLDQWWGHVCRWGLFRGKGWELLYHSNPSAATPMEEVCGICWEQSTFGQIRPWNHSQPMNFSAHPRINDITDSFGSLRWQCFCRNWTIMDSWQEENSRGSAGTLSKLSAILTVTDLIFSVARIFFQIHHYQAIFPAWKRTQMFDNMVLSGVTWSGLPTIICSCSNIRFEIKTPMPFLLPWVHLFSLPLSGHWPP